jgi:hypothetical protein
VRRRRGRSQTGRPRRGGLSRLSAPVPVAHECHCVKAAVDRGAESAVTRPILMAVQRAPMNAAGVAARGTARCSRSKPRAHQPLDALTIGIQIRTATAAAVRTRLAKSSAPPPPLAPAGAPKSARCAPAPRCSRSRSPRPRGRTYSARYERGAWMCATGLGRSPLRPKTTMRDCDGGITSSWSGRSYVGAGAPHVTTTSSEIW